MQRGSCSTNGENQHHRRRAALGALVCRTARSALLALAMSAMTAMTAGRPRPAVLGQLPTDCACFFRANFFVASAAGAELNQHFHFSEAETRDPDAFREAIILQLGEHAASDEELVEAVLAQIEKELKLQSMKMPI